METCSWSESVVFKKPGDIRGQSKYFFVAGEDAIKVVLAMEIFAKDNLSDNEARKFLEDQSFMDSYLRHAGLVINNEVALEQLRLFTSAGRKGCAYMPLVSTHMGGSMKGVLVSKEFLKTIETCLAWVFKDKTKEEQPSTIENEDFEAGKEKSSSPVDPNCHVESRNEQNSGNTHADKSAEVSKKKKRDIPDPSWNMTADDARALWEMVREGKRVDLSYTGRVDPLIENEEDKEPKGTPPRGPRKSRGTTGLKDPTVGPISVLDGLVSFITRGDFKRVQNHIYGGRGAAEHLDQRAESYHIPNVLELNPDQIPEIPGWVIHPDRPRAVAVVFVPEIRDGEGKLQVPAVEMIACPSPWVDSWLWTARAGHFGSPYDSSYKNVIAPLGTDNEPEVWSS